VSRTTAVLELEELIFAGRDERVAYSRDLFAPGGIHVMVLRTLEATRPVPVAGSRRARLRAAAPSERPVRRSRNDRS
jgi:hypothetical protein